MVIPEPITTENEDGWKSDLKEKEDEPTDEKDELIREMSERLRSLEEKERDRITFFGQVWDKSWLKYFILINVIGFTVVYLFVIANWPST